MVGLGQIVKSTNVCTPLDIDFCSKFTVRAGGEYTYHGWYMFRDPKKFVETKHYYNGSNKYIRNDPGLHVKALTECVKHELPLESFLSL